MNAANYYIQSFLCATSSGLLASADFPIFHYSSYNFSSLSFSNVDYYCSRRRLTCIDLLAHALGFCAMLATCTALAMPVRLSNSGPPTDPALFAIPTVSPCGNGTGVLLGETLWRGRRVQSWQCYTDGSLSVTQLLFSQDWQMIVKEVYPNGEVAEQGDVEGWRLEKLVAPVD